MVDTLLVLQLATAGMVVGAAVTVYFAVKRRKPSSTGAAAGSAPMLAPKPAVRYVIPPRPKEKEQLSDGLGQLLYLWLALGAEIIPVIGLLALGLNLIIVFTFFGLFPIVGVLTGYLFCRFRFAKTARDVNQILRRGEVLGVHIGTDKALRLIGGRRGATGVMHFPNMKIQGDPVQMATYPWSGTTAVIIRSDMDVPIAPDFVEYAQDIIQHSDQIGMDGQMKDPRKLMEILMDMKQQAEALDEYERVLKMQQSGTLELGSYIYDKYRPLIFNDPADPAKMDKVQLDKITRLYQTYLADDGKKIQEEREKLNKASVAVKDGGFEIEYERDLGGKLLGAHLVRNRPLNLNGIRKLWPTGGTAEGNFISGEHAKLGADALKGGTGLKDFLKWFGPFMIIVGFGIMVYFITHG